MDHTRGRLHLAQNRLKVLMRKSNDCKARVSIFLFTWRICLAGARAAHIFSRLTKRALLHVCSSHASCSS